MFLLHEKDVAAACIFLATKTEECGRKLRDIAKVYQSKVTTVHLEQLTREVCASFFHKVYFGHVDWDNT